MRLIGLVLIALLAGCSPQPEDTPPVAETPATNTGDYLSPELREEVEALKQSLQETPTDETNADERVDTLFRWINAYAKSGGYIPVNAPSVVAQVTAYGAPSGPYVDLFIRELTLVDEQPNALGPLTLVQEQPFTVREYGTFSQVYTVGEAPVKDGGGFMVPKHFQTNHGPFQFDDPAAPNYITLTSSNDAVTFTDDAIQVPGMHGGFRGADPQHVFRVNGTLQPGDTVTITYGDTSGGSPGLLMPDFKSDQMPFPLYVDLDGSDLFLSLPIQPVRIIGAGIDAVAGFAPSILAPGETADISIRAEDAYGNRATGSIPDWKITLEGEEITRIESGDSAVVRTNIEMGEPGVYRFRVESLDGQYVGDVNPIVVQDNPAERVYWGDTHGHSGFAEGIGSAYAYMQFARDEARLDFITHSEHDIWMDDFEWATLREMVQKYSKDGEFIAYLGYEWTVRQSQGGHHNVLFRTPEGRDRMPAQLYPTLSSLYQGLRENNDTDDVVIIPHAHQKGEYRYSDPEMETLIEIMSMHGTFEWFGRMYLSHGHEVGFVAASDDHIGRPGYASPKSSSLAQRGGLGAIFAPARTTDAIFDGMKRLRAYATSGQRMVVDFDVNGTKMGQRAPYAPSRSINATVHGTSPITSVTVFRNDKVLREFEYGDNMENELRLTFFSESYPFHPQDNPRGWRHWAGTMTVKGAKVISAELVDFQNLAYQSFEKSETDDNTYDFHTLTRGDHSSILLELDNAGPDVEVTLNLVDAPETGSGPPTRRRHQNIPGSSVTVTPGETLDMAFDGYKDTISLDYNKSAPLDVEISIDDNEAPRHGDYYFMRVRQQDEGLAWTSPVWVGGNPTR